MSAPYNPGWEAGLAARVRSGGGEREAALAEVVKTFQPQVHQLAGMLTREPAEAEDVSQEVFLAVMRGLRGFRGEARLSTWIYRITLRTAARVRARHPPGEPLPESLTAPEGPDPAIRAEELRALQAAMERLSEGHRVVLALFAVEGLSHRAIASVLGIPEGTVWSRLHTARKRLREELV